MSFAAASIAREAAAAPSGDNPSGAVRVPRSTAVGIAETSASISAWSVMALASLGEKDRADAWQRGLLCGADEGGGGVPAVLPGVRHPGGDQPGDDGSGERRAAPPGKAGETLGAAPAWRVVRGF